MRIASLVSAGTEMLYALGLGEQVVAVSHECDWPPECRQLPRVTRSNVDSLADSGAIDAQVRRMLVEGKPLYEVDSRALAELGPDLIVAQAQCDVCAVRYADVMDAVRSQSRLQQCQVIALNPTSLGDVLKEMCRIGDTAGIGEQGREVVARLRGRVERIRLETANFPAARRPRVAMIEWTQPLMLAGNWVPELIELAGGHCSLTNPGQPSRTIAWDELVRFDPDVIVVCPCGFDERRAEQEAKLLARRDDWSKVSAGRGQVFPVDGNAYFNRPGPRLVESLELLARICKSAGENGENRCV
jgi:iron complex transport system substrate-binding protein